MFKISNKLSITLSLILCVIVAGVCCGCAVVLPRIVEALCNVHTLLIISAPLIFDVNATAVLVVSYIILGFSLLADVLLAWLLVRVSYGLVFTEKSVALIRSVSWCCIGICLCFVVIGLKFRLGFVIACFILFLGLCLRVVKNVIAEATIIKSENDLTV